MKLAIAEHFISIQGEGIFTGAPMKFIRLAGCNVGVISKGILSKGGPAFTCTSYQGKEFTCDTDYRKTASMTPEEVANLIQESKLKHYCITGGEPLLQWEGILELYRIMLARHPDHEAPMMHIESSGTINEGYIPSAIWLTISPKKNALTSMLYRANEIKLVIGGREDLANIPYEILHHPTIFLQPINEELDINRQNVQLCLDLLKEHPTWRLSIQLHKLLGLR